eukprot:EG_transcript_25584
MAALRGVPTVAVAVLASSAVLVSVADPALTGAILAYDGSVPDVLLNYAVCLLQLAVVLWDARRRPGAVAAPTAARYTTVLAMAASQPRASDATSASCSSPPSSIVWWPLFLGAIFFYVFQVGLCAFVTTCIGVSIVWNAFTGLLVFEAYAVQRYPKQLLCWLLIPLTVAVDAYYLSVDVRQGDFLTSLAHALAVLLGVLVGLIQHTAGIGT